MKEAYMNTNLRSTQEAPEPLIERDWPHREWRRRGLIVRDDEPGIRPDCAKRLSKMLTRWRQVLIANWSIFNVQVRLCQER
jgi:hypothetical protein